MKKKERRSRAEGRGSRVKGEEGEEEIPEMNRNMRLEWRRAAVEIGAREEEQHWREGSRAEKKRRCVNSEERRREKKRSSRVKKRRA